MKRTATGWFAYQGIALGILLMLVSTASQARAAACAFITLGAFALRRATKFYTAVAASAAAGTLLSLAAGLPILAQGSAQIAYSIAALALGLLTEGGLLLAVAAQRRAAGESTLITYVLLAARVAALVLQTAMSLTNFSDTVQSAGNTVQVLSLIGMILVLFRTQREYISAEGVSE